MTIKQELSRRLHRCTIYQADRGWGHEDYREIPDDLHADLVAAHICPDCAGVVAIPNLVAMRFSKETPESNPGYECPECETFFATPSLHETVPQNEGYSDADPGL